MRGRERAVVALLAAVVVVDLVAVASSIAELNLLDRVDAGERVSDSELDDNDARQGAIGLVQTAFLIATAVFFIRWLRLASGLPLWLNVWWAGWIVSNILGQTVVVRRITRRLEDRGAAAPEPAPLWAPP